jgi:3-hydroxy-9,10-secoandrosta-1,3,5(10)-triene-9,17-dione monooxygenase
MDVTTPTYVPAPEPDLKPEQMIARARALRQMVREEAHSAEGRGYYSEALHKEFTKAGFTAACSRGASAVTNSASALFSRL